MKPHKTRCDHCLKEVYWVYIKGRSFPLDWDTNKIHTCDIDTPEVKK